MATTEEMNRAIVLYLDGTINDDIYYIPQHPEDATACYNGYANGLMFDTSWDWLMPVWDKLHPELKPFIYKVAGYNRTNNKGVNMKHEIADAIAYKGITEAHRLIYEAIVWLQNKPK